MRKQLAPAFSNRHLPAGARLGLAVSGGSDSVALLRLAHSLAPAHGWQLTVLHVQHGLRGAAAQADAAFVEALAATLRLPFRLHPVDAAAHARDVGTGLEDAGRRLRSQWFGALLAAGELDAIATGHTLDDQAETVLLKLLRGAWLQGLAGIHPIVAAADLLPPGASLATRGILVRPLLDTRRADLRLWLHSLDQTWREDASNADPTFTRNRIRHTLLPALRAFAPQVEEKLAHTAALAREDAAWWDAEVARLLPGLLLPGRAVRGGGRASSTLAGQHSLAFEAERLRAFPPALRGRLVRAAAAQLTTGSGLSSATQPTPSLSFSETASLLALCESAGGAAPRRLQLSHGLRAERTPRELRLILDTADTPQPGTPVAIPIPGSAEGFGVRLTLTPASGSTPSPPAAILRPAGPGDRVRLRYSSGAPRRIKEVLERLSVPSADRAGWPVLSWQGEVVWMRGALLEPSALARQLTITAEPSPANTPQDTSQPHPPGHPNR